MNHLRINVFLISFLLPAFLQATATTAEASQFKWFDDQSYPGHSVEMLQDGPATFAERIDLIRTAQSSIVMSTYAYKDDNAGKTLAAELCNAARRRVDVRMILDSYGSDEMRPRLPALRECGVHVVLNDIAHYGFTEQVFVTHDKLLIADGQRMIMGGSGIATYYRDYGRFYKDPATGAGWHDYFHRMFTRTWERYRVMSAGRPDPFDFSRESRHDLIGHGDPQFGTTTVPDCEASVHGRSRILPSYSNPYFERNTLLAVAGKALPPNIRLEVQAIRDSKKQILLYGAYFVAHPELIDALLDARKKTRDHDPVDITIITNSDDSNDDLPALITAMYKCVVPLIEAGVKIQLWTTSKQTMHRKGGVFDGKLAFFGSDNLDLRGQN